MYIYIYACTCAWENTEPPEGAWQSCDSLLQAHIQTDVSTLSENTNFISHSLLPNQLLYSDFIILHYKTHVLTAHTCDVDPALINLCPELSRETGGTGPDFWLADTFEDVLKYPMSTHLWPRWNINAPTGNRRSATAEELYYSAEEQELNTALHFNVIALMWLRYFVFCGWNLHSERIRGANEWFCISVSHMIHT